jgi:hypothetical protein
LEKVLQSSQVLALVLLKVAVLVSPSELLLAHLVQEMA